MNLNVDVDYKEYAEAIGEFIRERGTTLPKALRFEGRQLALRLVKFTPPKTLSQGRKAVARDIQRAVRPLRPVDFTSKRIRKLIRKRDYSGLEAIFSRFPQGSDLHRVSVVEPNFPEMHEQARASRGRVLKLHERPQTSSRQQKALSMRSAFPKDAPSPGDFIFVPMLQTVNLVLIAPTRLGDNAHKPAPF